MLPTLRDRRWAFADLDVLSRSETSAAGTNPLLDPEACDRFVRSVAERLGVDHTLGGYGEDRACLWRGHYHAPGLTTHLGIDLNAPAGTPVAAPAPCRVVRAVGDPDGDGGWGGFVVLSLDAPYRGCRLVVLGHLDPAGLPDEGLRLGAGEILGRLGDPSGNGGWYPHLHVQCVAPGAVPFPVPEPGLMDGYGRPGDIAGFPDPTELVCGHP